MHPKVGLCTKYWTPKPWRGPEIQSTHESHWRLSITIVIGAELKYRVEE